MRQLAARVAASLIVLTALAPTTADAPGNATTRVVRAALAPTMAGAPGNATTRVVPAALAPSVADAPGSATARVALGPSAADAPGDATARMPRSIVAGRSAEGRHIVALRTGSGASNVLVVGEIHGNETAGLAVVRALRELHPPAALSIWTVRAANPDGMNDGTRQNAHGVDLNRNFPYRWTGSGRPWDTYYPGPRRASEPETRAMIGLIRRLHAVLTVWFHQHMRIVVLEHGGDNSLIRDYARRVGLPARWLPYYRGTVTSWENHSGAKTAFVVELPTGALASAAAHRHARAVVAVGVRAS